MAGRIDAKLAELGITLPTPPAPIANYVPYVVTGNLVVRLRPGAGGGRQDRDTGKVGQGVTVEQGKAAARLCLHQRAGASEGGVRRRPGSRAARRAAGRLHRRARPSSPSTRR